MTVAAQSPARTGGPLSIVLSTMAVLAALFSLFSCSSENLSSPPERLTIAFSKTQYAALADIALVKGFFLEQGLEVTPRKFSYGKLALQDLLDGHAEMATVAETPITLAIMNGADISIIATIHSSATDNAIIARNDRGIAAPRDLRGKTVATTLGTTSDFYLDSFLSVNGISRRELRLVDKKLEEIPSALASGEVDAAAAFNPGLMRARRLLGGAMTTFRDESLLSQTFNLVAGKELIRQHPGKVVKVLRGLALAEDFFRQQPDQALKIVAEFNNIPLADAREMLSEARVALALDQSLLLALEDESQWAIRAGLCRRKTLPNYLDYIYLDGLNSVQPAAVRIIR